MTHLPRPRVVGFVVDAEGYNAAERGRGVTLARTDHPGRVFLHARQCRRVTGTPDKPTLTDEEAEVILTDNARVVMEVREDRKGHLKAVRWGPIDDPKRDDDQQDGLNWINLEELRDVRWSDYVGGTIDIKGCHFEQAISVHGTITEVKLNLNDRTFTADIIFDLDDGSQTRWFKFSFSQKKSTGGIAEGGITLKLQAPWGPNAVTVLLVSPPRP